MTHIAGLTGLKNFDQFRVQMIPDGQVPPNSIPITSRGASAGNGIQGLVGESLNGASAEGVV